jgi:hypothetical protein
MHKYTAWPVAEPGQPGLPCSQRREKLLITARRPDADMLGDLVAQAAALSRAETDVMVAKPRVRSLFRHEQAARPHSIT